MKFQLTHPMRGATGVFALKQRDIIISTHTPHAGCDKSTMNILMKNQISTHTPHAGCDAYSRYINLYDCISTHTPHAGCDHDWCIAHLNVSISTHTPHAGCDLKEGGDLDV